MQVELIQQLYRKEFTRMVAVLSNLLGLQDIALAEDLASAAFLEAAQRWKTDGLPANPSAWLYKVAKNKVYYHFRRNSLYQKKLSKLTKAEEQTAGMADFDFSPDQVFDSQLKMLFALCDPVIASEAQIGLALRILCGFTIEEIAQAFFTNKETINKRLFRAKEKLREARLKLEMPQINKIEERLNNVLHVIYLLFNEGYYSSSSDSLLRKNLCSEALSLGLMLGEYELTCSPKTNALIALMCFHSSRLDTRISPTYELVLYDEQDSRQWDKGLIAKGMYYLEQAAGGKEVSSYHLEAGIAFLNCQPGDSQEKWQQILHHYNLLLQVNYTPATVLNRIYALFKSQGALVALHEMVEVPVMDNHFYYTLLGTLYEKVNKEESLGYYHKALHTCKTASEKKIIESKIQALLLTN